MAPPPWIDDAALLPDWMDSFSREALEAASEGSPAALVAVGRLLRGGHLPGGARRKLEEKLRGQDLRSVEEGLRAHVEALGDQIEEGLRGLEAGLEASALWALLAQRDDLESLSWALGLAGPESLEKLLLDRCRTLDGRALARRDRLAMAVPDLAGAPAWLFAVAEHSPGAWWSNLLVAGEHRPEIEQWLTRPLVGSAISSLGLSPRALHRAAALQFGGEATSEPEAILARPLGAPVASLFDGAVLVHTHGMAEHDDEVPPGLVVRHAEGDFEAILEVRLEPEGAGLPHRSPLALAWWVPLAGAPDERRVLQVKLKSGESAPPLEDRLDLDAGGE